MDKLFYGDNLDILRRYIDDKSADLIYLDPPFKSNQDYNVLFREQDGSRAASQIMAFEDTWEWNQASAASYHEVVEAGGDVSLAMQAFFTLLGGNDMMAYLSMMAPRLVELRRVLTPEGSIYLHCDPTASHYLKLLMDAVFGADNLLMRLSGITENGLPVNTRFKEITTSFYSIAELEAATERSINCIWRERLPR